jgi:hypothetical protein
MPDLILSTFLIARKKQLIANPLYLKRLFIASNK